MLETIQDAKTTLQTYCDSAWVFAVLNVASEINLFNHLKVYRSFDELQSSLKLPAILLQQCLNVLTVSGFIQENNDQFILSNGMQKLVEQVGLEKIHAQIANTFGLSSAFVKSIEDKNCKLGWYHRDEKILQSQGIRSEYIATDCLKVDKRIDDLLNQEGATFLDVGAGVGKISIKVCELYPQVKVSALEPADTPFMFAEQNIKLANYHQRIELRKMSVEDLKDEKAFDVVWFPHFFLDDKTLNKALFSIKRALKPGGIVLTNVLCENQLDQIYIAVRHLISVLYGGFRTKEVLFKAFQAIGLNDIREWHEMSGYQVVTAS